MKKIQRISLCFRWLFQIIFMVMPVLLVIFWMNAPKPLSATAAHFGFGMNFIPRYITFFHPLSPMTKFSGFLVSLIPLAVSLLVLYFLIRLFKRFEQCDFFCYQNVRYIKYIGLTLFIGQLLHPAYQALLTYVLTLHNYPGKPMVMISFTGADIGVLLTALAILLVSWIMAEGYKLKEEQQYTV